MHRFLVVVVCVALLLLGGATAEARGALCARLVDEGVYQTTLAELRVMLDIMQDAPLENQYLHIVTLTDLLDDLDTARVIGCRGPLGLER